MSKAALPIMERTLHETNIWLNDISAAIEDSRREMAYHALRGVLFALRDRLSVNEVFDLSAQLPLFIRGVFFEGYRPEGKPEKHDRAAFLAQVRGELQAMGGGNPERVTRAVFGVIGQHVSAGEVEDMVNELPKDLRALWPDAAAKRVSSS